MTEALSEPVASILEAGSSDTWQAVRGLYRHESDKAISSYLADLAGFELDKETVQSLVSDLRDFCRGVVEKKAREEASKVLIHMKDR